MTATHASTLVLAFALAAAASADDPCTETWADALGAHPSLNALDLLSADVGDGTRLYIAGYGGGLGISEPFYVASFDGSTWEVLGSDFDGDVNALAVFDDGAGPALYAGGRFESTADGAPMRNLAKWNGERWQPLAEELEGQAVSALVEFQDGSVRQLIAALHGGDDSADPYQIATWNGAQWQILAGGIDGYVRDLCVWDDGFGPALYAGGSFEHIDGRAINGLARYRQGAWEQLGAGLGPVSGDSIPSVATLAAFDDGAGDALYVGGRFNQAGATDALNIAKWTGSDWETVGDWTVDGAERIGPRRFATYDEGVGAKLYIGEPYHNGLIVWDGDSAETIGADLLIEGADQFCVGIVEGVERLVVVHDSLLYWDGEELEWGFPAVTGRGRVWDLLAVDDGSSQALYVSGDIGSIAGERCYVAQWTGDAWQALPGLDGGCLDSGIRALAFVPNDEGGLLYATGSFPPTADVTGDIAAWDGEQWQPLGTGLDDPYVTYGHSLAIFDSGAGPEVYVSGHFTSAGAVPAKNIARWDGGQWHGLKGGLGNPADVMCVADVGNGERLYMIGDFFGVDLLPVGYIAAWDGSDWQSLEGGFDAEPRALAVLHEDGQDVLYVAGDFTTAGGRPCPGFARWDGEHWLSAGSLPDSGFLYLQTVDIPTGQRLLALSTTYMGDDAYIGRAYLQERGAWIELGEFDHGLRAAATLDDGSAPALFVGGSFDHVGDLWARGIARRNLCDPDDIAADLDGDGFIDQTDLGLLLAAYDTCAGDDFYDDRADLTGDACVDHADLGAFLQAYPT